MLRISSCLNVAIVLLYAVSPAPAGIAMTDGLGRVRALSLDGRLIDISADIRVFSEGWTQVASLDERAKRISATQTESQRAWADRLTLAPGQTFLYEQTLSEADGKIRLKARVTAESDRPAQEISLAISLHTPAFGGGRCVLQHTANGDQTIMLPPAQSDEPHLLAATADRFTVATAAGDLALAVQMHNPSAVLVQDERKWGTDEYAVMIQMTNHPLRKGESAERELTLTLSGKVDHSKANVTIDPAPTPFAFDGFGGNFCFNPESPVSAYLLNHLRVNWARVEMRVDQWAVGGNGKTVTAQPEADDQSTWQARDRDGTVVHNELQMAAELERRHVPTVITVWRLPLWMFQSPKPDEDGRARGPLAEEHWPALTRAITAYLLHLKAKYATEPALFSFNESDYGVDLKLNADQHRAMVRRIGEAFAKAGLKTRLLVGDFGSPRNNRSIIAPTLADENSRGFAGAIAFHSWGGARAEEYAQWSEAAANASLPLLVTELGYDPEWRTVGGWLHTHFYAMQELRLDMELLTQARPAGLLQWEFTDDYALAWADNGRWQTDERFALLKQFCNLTPRKSRYLVVTCEQKDVLVAAFATTHGQARQSAIHLANMGPARSVHLSGISASTSKLNAVRTSETERAITLPEVAAHAGVVDIELPAQSLTTLTTLPGN